MTTLMLFDTTGMANGVVLAAGSAGSGDLAITAVSGQSMTKVTSDAGMADCWELPAPGGASAYLRWDLGTDRKILGIRYYFKKVSAWSSAAWQMVSTYDVTSAGLKARTAVAGSASQGQVRFLDAVGGSTNSPTGLFALDAWVRMEMYIKADTTTTGQWRALAYSAHSTTPLWDSGWQTGKDVGIGTEQVRMGQLVSVTGASTIRFAHLKVTDDADTLIGPWETAPAIPQLRMADGRAAVIQGWWDGTTLVPAVIKN